MNVGDSPSGGDAGGELAPSWPQLVGWMAAARPATLSGRWRAREDGQPRSGTFVFAAPDLWHVQDEQGRTEPAWDLRHLLQGEAFERGDDYHRPVDPPTTAVHDGRPCWRVTLEAPAHKSGLLTLLVDRGTGLRLAQRNDDHDYLTEVLDLRVDEPVDEECLEAARRQQHTSNAERDLYSLTRRQPAPTPRWFPWRRGWAERDNCWIVEADDLSGSVGRAPLGEEAPVAEEWLHLEADDIVRLDHDGWSWAVACSPRLTDEQARHVVEAVLPGPPPDHENTGA